MRCDRVQHLVPLFVGDDLDEVEAAPVRNHLSACATCRAIVDRLTGPMKALRESADTPTVPVASVKPAVMQGIQSTHVGAKPDQVRFNGWIPGLAVAAAILLMLNFMGDRNKPAQLTTDQASQTPLPLYSEAVTPTNGEGFDQDTELRQRVPVPDDLSYPVGSSPW